MEPKGGAMRTLILVGLIPAALLGCRTFQDIEYNKAHNAAQAGNYAEAFTSYQSVAAVDGYDGQASAQFLLGDMYLTGRGTARDPQAALRMFEAAANNTDQSWSKLALTRLAMLYETGKERGIPRDRPKAAEFYQRAARLGDDTAAEGYQRLLRYPDVYVSVHPGEFRHQTPTAAPGGLTSGFVAFKRGDIQSALRIFEWHAKNGNEQAQASLAGLYKEGAVVAKDPKKYAAWSWLAAQNGNAAAQLELGILISQGDGLPGSDKEAEEWFLRAADQGMVEATNWLGILAAHPVDADKEPDHRKAFSFFQKAAEEDSVFALVNLADAYQNGLGTTKDLDRARALYEQAAAAGNLLARTRLFEVYGIAHLKEGPPATPKKEKQDDVAKVQSASVAVRETPNVPTPVEIFSRVSPSVFRLVALNVSGRKDDASQGSAVAISEDTAITNCHVIEGKDAIGRKSGDVVTFFTLAGGNRSKDVCKLRADNKLKPVGTVRRYADLKIGETVYAIGSPQSLENTISEGIISGLRMIDGVRYIQTSAPISSGSSGGGLFDENGRLIGITTFKYRDAENLNFAVAIDEALDLIGETR
jgi:TPR repeat protein